VALTVVGARRGDGRAVLVGPAFSAMAALLAIHGLTTPGLLAGQNGVVVFSGAATLPVGGAVLALSAVPEIRQPWNISRLLWLQGVLLALIAVGAAGILAPAIVPSVPAPGGTPAWIVLVIGMAFYGTLAVRAARTFLLTHRQADLLVVLGLPLTKLSRGQCGVAPACSNDPRSGPFVAAAVRRACHVSYVAAEAHALR